MRTAYKIILTKANDEYLVTVPDFNCKTEGKDIADALYMARDVIGAMGISMEDMGKEIPAPDSATIMVKKGDIVTYVDVDFVEYRRRVDNRKIKKTLSIPSWLNERAEAENINFSRVLEEGLKRVLQLSDV